MIHQIPTALVMTDYLTLNFMFQPCFYNFESSLGVSSIAFLTMDPGLALRMEDFCRYLVIHGPMLLWQRWRLHVYD